MYVSYEIEIHLNQEVIIDHLRLLLNLDEAGQLLSPLSRFCKGIVAVAVREDM